MNYAAMKWAVEDCQLEGAAKPILFVIGYRGDRDTGYCWAGQRRIAKEAGVTRTHTQRVMAELVDIGVLEVEPGSGPKADMVRIAPALVEGQAVGSDVVEGSASATDVVEGQTVAGEVIHNPRGADWFRAASGHMTWPQASDHDELVATLLGASGHMEPPEAGLVATSSEPSGHMLNSRLTGLTSAKPEMSESQGYKQVLRSKAREEQVRENADSTADAVGVLAAAEPPPVSDAHKRWLAERFGPKTKPKPGPRAAPGPERQPRTREQQLAELAASMTREERERLDRVAHAQPATITFGVVDLVAVDDDVVRLAAGGAG